MCNIIVRSNHSDESMGGKKLSDSMEDTVKRVLQDPDTLSILTNLIKESVISELKDTIAKNTEVIVSMTSLLAEKDKKIEELESKIDNLEQYGRRQCLRVFGVKEEPGEDTDKLVVDIAKKIGVELSVNDIDRSHRIGAKSDERSHAIVVKFVSYRKRGEVFRNKKQLKSTGIVIREDLTKARHKLLQDCITRYGIHNVWTLDGTIIVKTGDTKRKINSASDLQ